MCCGSKRMLLKGTLSPTSSTQPLANGPARTELRRTNGESRPRTGAFPGQMRATAAAHAAAAGAADGAAKAVRTK